MRRCALLVERAVASAVFLLVVPTCVGAYPEFQRFVRANSGRATNCAMCHEHSDGPDGAATGQIGALDPEGLAQLNRARGAFQPGQHIDSPILNDFGDEIIDRLGKTRLLEIRNQPAALAESLGIESDLDSDGIPDAQEYLDGTHPLKQTDGNPWRLFLNNLVRFRFHVFMIALATILTIYGLVNLLRATHASYETAQDTRETDRAARSRR